MYIWSRFVLVPSPSYDYFWNCAFVWRGLFFIQHRLLPSSRWEFWWTHAQTSRRSPSLRSPNLKNIPRQNGFEQLIIQPTPISVCGVNGPAGGTSESHSELWKENMCLPRLPSFFRHGGSPNPFSDTENYPFGAKHWCGCNSNERRYTPPNAIYFPAGPA